MGFGLGSVVCIKLGMQFPTCWLGARYTGPTLLAMAVTVAHLQPHLSLHWYVIAHECQLNMAPVVIFLKLSAKNHNQIL